MWAGRVVPVDSARGRSTVTSASWQRWKVTATCWTCPPATASRWVSPESWWFHWLYSWWTSCHSNVASCVISFSLKAQMQKKCFHYTFVIHHYIDVYWLLFWTIQCSGNVASCCIKTGCRENELKLVYWFSAQVEACVYQAVKDLVRQYFQVNGAGIWDSKKLVDYFGAWTWTNLSFQMEKEN